MIYAILLNIVFNIQTNTEGIVISLEGVNIRAEPSLSSERIGVLGYKETVIIVDTIFFKRNAVSEEPTNNWWYKIEASHGEGYVYGHYLVAKSLDKRSKWLSECMETAEDGYIALIGRDCYLNIPKSVNYTFVIYSESTGIERIDANDLSIKNDVFNDMMPISISISGKRTNLGSNAFVVGLQKDQLVEETGKDETYEMRDGQPISTNEYKMGTGKVVFEYTETEGPSMYFIQNNKRTKLVIGGCANRVIYHGDLDKDGNEDLIILHGDKGAALVHYEVEHGKGGDEIIRVRGYAETGYCC